MYLIIDIGKDIFIFIILLPLITHYHTTVVVGTDDSLQYFLRHLADFLYTKVIKSPANEAQNWLFVELLTHL